MRKEQFWWIDEGYFPFDAGNDAYPCPGQVVQQYRIRKFVDGRPLRQSDLACMLCITERAVWAMEHTNEGLDSFQRRVELALLLDIPPVVLKLDASSLSKQYEHQRPGQVVKEYRKKKKKDDGKCWTQAELAELLEISEKSIQSMEKHDTGLDSVSRRELLIKLLNIPPVLLGLDTLHCFDEVPAHTSAEPRLPKRITQAQEKLEIYQSLVPAYWEGHFASGDLDSIEEIEKAIYELRGLSPYVNDRQQQLIRELLCQYHQLALNHARDLGHFETALDHAHLAIILAEKMGQKELLAAALYRRGLTHFDVGDIVAATADLEDALSHARTARPQLKGMVHMEAGRFQAHLAQSWIDRLQAEKLLDQTEHIVGLGKLEDDAGCVKLDKGRYHIGRAATLLALHRPEKALLELDQAARLTKTEYIRRHAYIDILRAWSSVAKGEFDYATELALTALPTCLAIRSESNIADIAHLYQTLVHTSFGNDPSVVHLRMILQSQRK